MSEKVETKWQDGSLELAYLTLATPDDGRNGRLVYAEADVEQVADALVRANGMIADLRRACELARLDYENVNYPTEAHLAVMAELDKVLATNYAN